jgi:hypothetical protein
VRDHGPLRYWLETPKGSDDQSIRDAKQRRSRDCELLRSAYPGRLGWHRRDYAETTRMATRNTLMRHTAWITQRAAMESRSTALSAATASLDDNSSIVAHLLGGPLDGAEAVLQRASTSYIKWVRGGIIRRLLRQQGKYAHYRLRRTWYEDGIQHGSYEFVAIQAHHEGGGPVLPS